jgi:hypothetical protein
MRFTRAFAFALFLLSFLLSLVTPMAYEFRGAKMLNQIILSKQLQLKSSVFFLALRIRIWLVVDSSKKMQHQ